MVLCKLHYCILYVYFHLLCAVPLFPTPVDTIFNPPTRHWTIQALLLTVCVWQSTLRDIQWKIRVLNAVIYGPVRENWSNLRPKMTRDPLCQLRWYYWWKMKKKTDECEKSPFRNPQRRQPFGPCQYKSTVQITRALQFTQIFVTAITVRCGLNFCKCCLRVKIKRCPCYKVDRLP